METAFGCANQRMGNPVSGSKFRNEQGYFLPERYQSAIDWADIDRKAKKENDMAPPQRMFSQRFQAWTMEDDCRFNISNIESRGSTVEDLVANSEISINDWHGNEAREGWTADDLHAKDFEELQRIFSDWLAGS
jgi:hypothetical protein